MPTGGQNISKYATLGQLEAFFINDVGLLTVKAYGAVGDGVTDDTTAILAAIADVGVRGVKSLYFPHGSYKVDPLLISASSFTGIFVWGDNSDLTGISHPINQIGTNISMITTFLGLTDTPGTFEGQAAKVVSVNIAEDALEFTTAYTQAYIDSTFYTKTELGNGQLDGRYYTETELDEGALDSRYFTEAELDEGALDSRYFTETELLAGALNDIYYTETEMDHGMMDKRYYTETELAIDGALDTRYYTETEIDANFASKQELANLILGEFPAETIDGSSIKDNSIGTTKMKTEQKRGVALGVASLDAAGKVLEEPASKAQASGIASLDSSGKVVQEPAAKGQMNGIASLDSSANVPLSQLTNALEYADEGDLENTLQLTNALFMLQAQVSAGFNELSQLAVDVFNDSNGIDSGISYTYDSGAKLVKSNGIFTRSSDQKTVTANGNAIIKTFINDSGKTITAVTGAQIDTSKYKVGSSSCQMLSATLSHLSVADSADFQFINDFTISTWVNFNSIANGRHALVAQLVDALNYWYVFIFNNSGSYSLGYYLISNNVERVNFSVDISAPNLDQWYHWELCRSGNTYKMFWDGTQAGTDHTDSDQPIDMAAALTIGQVNGTYHLDGHIDEFEILKGLAKHTSNFTPSTTQLDPQNPYTKLLLHFEGPDTNTNIADGSSSIYPKLGSAFGNFDGTGDFLSIPDSNDFSFSTNDFTLRTYVDFRALPGSDAYQVLISQYTDANNQWYWALFNNSANSKYEMKFVSINGGTTTTATYVIPSTPVIYQWYHWELCRNGNYIRMFINGVLLDSISFNAEICNSTGTLVIGALNSGSYFSGALDELEIAKGIARHTSTFTPPTAELSCDDYTMLLLHMNGTNDSTTFTDTNAQSQATPMTLISDTLSADSTPTKMFAISNETIVNGSVTYYVSRDGGTTWTEASKDTLIDVTTQPSGTSCKLKAVTTYVTDGDIKINAWALGYK